MWRKRLTAYWPELVVVLAVLVLFGDAVFTSASFFTRDMGAYEIPMRAWWRQQVLAGHFPHWLPNMGLGVPVVANPVTQALYPFVYLTLLPFPQSLDLYVVGHLVFAGLGATRLARRLGADAPGSCVAGLSYAIGGFLISMTTNPFYVCSDSYIPWIVCAMLRVRETPAATRSIAVLAGLVALQLLAGAFQGAMLGLGLGAAIVLATELHANRALRWAHIARVTAAMAAAVVVAVLLASAQLVPALRFAAVSTRAGGIDMETVLAFSTHPLRLLNIFISKPFGLPFTGPYFAAHLEQMDMPFPWAYSLYSGAASLVLVPLALARRDRIPAARVWLLFALLLLSWLMALGAHAPVYALAYRVVPLLDRFRFPEKFFSLASLLTALLSGLGVSAWLAAPARRRDVWPALLCLALPVSAAVAGACFPNALARALLDPRLSAEAALRGAALFGQQSFFAAALGLVALAALWIQRSGLLVAVHALDLIVAGFAIHRTADLSDVRLAPQIAERVARAEQRIEPMRLFSSRHDFIGGDPEAFERMDLTVARPNRGIEQGVHQASSFTSTVVQASANLEVALVRGDYDRLIRTLCVTSVITDSAEHARGLFAKYRVVADWGPLLLLDVPDPVPRARVVFRAATVPSDKDAVALMVHPRFPADDVAVFVGELPAHVPQLHPPEPPPGSKACRFSRYAPEHVAFTCELDQPGIAVLADQFIDGWTLELDGKPAAIQRVDVAYRGVELPPGKHTLVYRYTTPGFALGGCVSGIGLVLLGVLLLRRRRST
jgi:hypothetical protein